MGGALIGLKVGAPHPRRGARTQAPSGLGRAFALGVKAPRGSG